MTRAGMGGGAGAGAAGDAEATPGVEAPLSAEEMDAIKQDLHFAVAGAMRGVLEAHRGGVVLLNVPDHNKPAGFFHGDGAGMLQETRQESRKLHAEVLEQMADMRRRFERMEERLNVQIASGLGGGSGSTVAVGAGQADARSSGHKVLYAVQSPHGGQINVESRLLPGLHKDQLAESADEMKELLQSWYRSFAFVSKLKAAVEPPGRR
jgi:hypothetical protein